MRDDRERLLDILEAIELDTSAVWNVVEGDLPALKQQVEAILAELS